MLEIDELKYLLSVLKSKAFGLRERLFSESLLKCIGCNLFSHVADMRAMMVIFLYLFNKFYLFIYLFPVFLFLTKLEVSFFNTGTSSATPDITPDLMIQNHRVSTILGYSA